MAIGASPRMMQSLAWAALILQGHSQQGAHSGLLQFQQVPVLATATTKRHEALHAVKIDIWNIQAWAPETTVVFQ